MAETGRRRQGELVRGVFALLFEKPDGMAAADVLAELERRVPATAFENEASPRNPTVRRYPKLVRFSTIPSVKAGWLVKESGRWSLTDEGRQAYERFTDPAEFMAESARLYRAWKRQQPPTGEDDEDQGDGDAESTIALEEAEEAASGAIREYLTTMPP